mmetsp:Transcript_83742/g.245555  ORF Transcript_83742/g.245555 Transcript_83742/m.245555 type:complete len:289 (-) Transcript_83742:3-869(-)
MINPVLEEPEPLDEIVRVAPEGLQGGVAVRQPHGRRLAVEDRQKNLLQVLAHEQQALDGLLDVLEACPDDAYEIVEAVQLLDKHRVHGLFVHGRVLLLHRRYFPGLGHALQDVVGDLPDGILGGGAPAARGLAHGQQQAIHHAIGLALLPREVGVLVEAVNTRGHHQGHAADEVHDGLLAARRGHGVHRVLETEGVALRGRPGAVVVGQERHEEAPVLLFRDAAAVVALAREVVERLELELLRRVIDEHPELPGGDAEVVLRELVWDVPAQGAEEAPLLDHRVEEESE